MKEILKNFAEAKFVVLALMGVVFFFLNYGEPLRCDDLIYQYYWLNAHLIQIQHKSENLYRMYASGRLDSRITERCCNYRLLEEKCKEWKKS